MGPPTDPGPSGSARASKWSVRPCIYVTLHFQVGGVHVRTHHHRRLQLSITRSQPQIPRRHMAIAKEE
ncbi:unnamed protein product [Staurois parvus]|uniref:Uncharacterized protein n=1 Tax=Staurois parvus TaxID=386267 RepID=A0ABN9AFR9_9NEOB|nr:unnamed protein product [Staurois parvus]